MRIQMLGGVSVIHDVGAAPMSVPPRLRLILAMLASRSGRIVSEDQLVDAIWGERPPASARTALQTYVGGLRDLLEPDRQRRSPGSFVITHEDGYALVAAPDVLDLAQFEDAIEQGRRVHVDDPGAALAALDTALALWAEPLFGEFADAPWARGVGTRLRDTHAAALESRFGLALDAGTAGPMGAAMTAAVQTYPYRERLAGQRMVALYRRGEQARALEQYAATRQRLADDLGLEPGRELRLLERAILTHDPALRRRGDTSVEVDRTSDRQGRTRLIGRDPDLDRVVELLADERCVSLVGPGGVGKTTLAEHVARRIEARGDRAVYRVDLADQVGREVVRAVAEELRVVEHPLASLADSIVDSLSDRSTLLVIETCEAALDETARVVAQLLAAPELLVMTTSQVPLGLRDEFVVRLQPLQVDDAIEVLTRGRSVTPGERPSMIAIVERLDCLPLAVELASARLSALGPTELLRGLQADHELLRGGDDRPERQRTARATVDWSLALLHATAHETLTELATFAAPFTIDAARAITGRASQIGALIGELVDRSLLQRVDAEPTRFRLLDSVRLALGSSSEIVEAAQTRVTDLVIAAAQAHTFDTAGPVSLFELAGEIIPTLDRLDAAADQRQLILSGMLGQYFIVSGRLGEGVEQLDNALTASPHAPSMVRFLVTGQLGFLTWYLGDLSRTRRILREVEVDDALTAPLRAGFDGCLAFVEQRFADSARCLRIAVAAPSAATKQRLMLLHLAGNASWYAGDRLGAIELYHEQRELADEVDDVFSVALSLRFSAMVTAQLGDIDSAWRWTEQSMSMVEESGDPVGKSQSYAAAAVVASISGETGDAVRYAVDTVHAARRYFDVFAFRNAVPILADASHRVGDFERAARLAGWYQDLLDRTGHAPSPAIDHLDVDTQLRAALEPNDFARFGAHGAVGGVSGVAADAAAVAAMFAH